jgi:uncharacterized protein (TIGR00645 family)
VITDVLSLIDLALIASLVLMVMLACYEKFRLTFRTGGSQIQAIVDGPCRLWELKVKLPTSIVAISTIHVLEIFMNIGPASDHELKERWHPARLRPLDPPPGGHERISPREHQ